MIRFNLVKRKPLKLWQAALLPVAAIALSLAASAGLIALSGAEVGASFAALFGGALGTRFNFLETCTSTVPLVFTGLSVAFAFRARFWNIGAEGQLLAGATAATAVALGLGGLPSFVALPLVVLVGCAAGGVWAAIPALLRTRLKVDDVVSTLLLNYVMANIMGMLLFGPLKAPGASWPMSPLLPENTYLPALVERSRFHAGVLLALAMVALVWLVQKFSVFGYTSKAVGANLRAAAYGGINTGRVILVTALASGGLAGLAGVSEVLAIQHKLLTDLSPGYGYTGVVVAMLGELHPVGVLASAFFFSLVGNGAQAMSRITHVPVYIAQVIQGLSLLFMLVLMLFKQYRIVVRR